MTASIRVALLLGVVSIAAGPALAQDYRADGAFQQRSERSADRLLSDFDRNEDGRVTRAEMNGTLGWRFAAATRGSRFMNVDQFLAVRAEAFKDRNAETFRSLDWNSDGRLSLTEFAAPRRARFVTMDRDGAGYVWCAAGTERRSGSSWRGAVSRFCADNDVNMDGRVTRAELDTAVAKRFAQSARASMTLDQFQLSEQLRYAVANARAFRRLDANEDGRLTVQEFGASEVRQFARIDKNRDGILQAGELHPQRIARADRGQRRRFD